MSADLPAATAGDNESNKWLAFIELIEAYKLTLGGSPSREINDAERTQTIYIIDKLLNEGEVKMSDTYTAGQAAAFGPHAQAHDVTFNQVWNQVAATVDLPQLENELGILRQALKRQANAPEHDIAIAEVANAEIAARNRDGSKVIEHLRKAGKWVLTIAKDLGCEVTASVIAKTIGL